MTATSGDGVAGVLGEWLRARLAEDGEVFEDVVCTFDGPVPTGNSNVTMPFTASCSRAAPTLELVLRMQVPVNQIFLDADVLREFRILEALSDIGSVPVPRPRWAEADPSVLGQPFFVMERVRGIVPTGSPSIHATGWLTERTADQLSTAWSSAIGAIVAIRRVGWRTHLPFLADGCNGTSLATRLEHVSSWYSWVVGERHYPITDAALEHLLTHVPRATGEPALCWGDARLGNLMFGGDHRVVAVLDWELASIGPPGIDLGWWLTFDEFTTAAHGVPRLPGYPDRTATIDRYEELSGETIDDLRWYEVYCAWVLTVTVIRMADIQVAAGRLSPDNRMGHGNLTAQMLARWLELPVPALDPDYAARRGLPTG